MFVYKTLRSITLSLRSAQTALLAASFFVSDTAQSLGRKAKNAAHAKLDAIHAAADRKNTALWMAVGEAEARAEQHSADLDDLVADHTEARVLIEREVL